MATPKTAQMAAASTVVKRAWRTCMVIPPAMTMISHLTQDKNTPIYRCEGQVSSNDCGSGVVDMFRLF